MKLVNGWYTDANGNCWDATRYSKEDIMSAGLVDCKDCTDCFHCTSCIKCVDCKFCTNCVESRCCRHSSALERCHSCEYSHDCVDSESVRYSSRVQSSRAVKYCLDINKTVNASCCTDIDDSEMVYFSRNALNGSELQHCAYVAPGSKLLKYAKDTGLQIVVPKLGSRNDTLIVTTDSEGRTIFSTGCFRGEQLDFEHAIRSNSLPDVERQYQKAIEILVPIMEILRGIK